MSSPARPLPDDPLGSTQARILDAATRLFAERGYHAVGMRELAEAVGIRPASLYNHCASKQELLFTIAHGTMTELREGAEAAVAGQPDARSRLRAWVVWHVTYHALHRERREGGRRAVPRPRRRAAAGRAGGARRATSALVKGLIDDGVAAHGWVVPHRSVVTNAITTMCTAVDDWFREDGPLGADEVAAIYADLVLASPGAGAVSDLPQRAEVVVVGGGAAGTSLAYHLARLGQSDVVLLEQHELTSGSTWHAAGLCTQWSGSWSLMRTLRASVDGFAELEADTGLPVDFHQTGSVRLCMSRDRLDEFHHNAGVAATAGVPVEIVDAARALELFPLLNVEDVIAAAWLPTDGHVDPTALTNAFAAGARSRGVTDRAARARAGADPGGRRLDRADAAGRRAGARRRDRRRPVVAAGGPPRRREPADRAAAAPLRRDRRGAPRCRP